MSFFSRKSTSDPSPRASDFFPSGRDPSPHVVDAPQEHQITLPGIELAFNHTTQTVYMLDQTGADNTDSLRDLDEWFEKIGYHLHCVKIAPPAPGEAPPRRPDEDDSRRD